MNGCIHWRERVREPKRETYKKRRRVRRGSGRAMER